MLRFASYQNQRDRSPVVTLFSCEIHRGHGTVPATNMTMDKSILCIFYRTPWFPMVMLAFGGIISDGMVLLLPGNLWFALHVADPWSWRLPVTSLETGWNTDTFVRWRWLRRGVLFLSQRTSGDVFLIDCYVSNFPWNFSHKNILGSYIECNNLYI